METLSEINRRLIDYFGYADGDKPRYRLVWSPEQFEKRKCTHSEGGVLLLHSEVREVPKYKVWADRLYIVEAFIPVPSGVETDLIEPYSYEPVWVFRVHDKDGTPKQPSFAACRLVADSRQEGMKPSLFKKYKDHQETNEEYEIRIKEIMAELFGNETAITDALAYHGAVSLSGSYKE